MLSPLVASDSNSPAIRLAALAGMLTSFARYDGVRHSLSSPDNGSGAPDLPVLGCDSRCWYFCSLLLPQPSSPSTG